MVEKSLPYGGLFLFALFCDLTSRPMDAQELHRAAREAFNEFDGSQSDLAAYIGVGRSAVSRAVRNAGLKHAAVQARIVSHVEGVPVQRRSTYDAPDVSHEWVLLEE